MEQDVRFAGEWGGGESAEDPFPPPSTLPSHPTPPPPTTFFPCGVRVENQEPGSHLNTERV